MSKRNGASAGLLDVLPPPKTVTIQGKDFSVTALGGRTISRILGKHENLRAYFTGREVDAVGIFQTALDAVPSIIAAGMGKPFDAETEEQADMIGLENQMELVTAILEATMPRGIDPFIEKFTALGRIVSGASGAEDTSSKTSLRPS